MTNTSYNNTDEEDMGATSSSSCLDVAMGDSISSEEEIEFYYPDRQPVASKTLHLRWTNLLKSVETRDTDARNSLHRRHRASIDNNMSGSIHTKVTPNAKRTTRVILDRISGEACPGEILATMGPSGSGKTSLMNVLSGRATYQEGSITLNGKILDKAGMKRLKSRVAYVKQQDIFFETLTVRDQLTYTARLRFPDVGISRDDRALKIRTEVDKVLELLKLIHVADNLIAMCSGGEKKRVNIGTELLTNPSLILLDEPTSGLDSASAVSLLNVLRDLAKNHGKTIITSIHQPNSATFLSTFDKLLMLSDGNAVYFGTPVESLRYLKAKGLPCLEGYNAADHWMDLLVTDTCMENDEHLLSSSMTSNQDWSRKQLPKIYLKAAWDGDAIATKLAEAEELQRSTTDSEEVVANNRKSLIGGVLVDPEQSKYVTSWWTQYKSLTHRALKKSQHKFFSAINIIKTVATGVVVGIVYLNQTYTESDVYNIYAYFFFTMLYWVMNGLFEALFAFPQERIVILKERATASYRLSAYFCAMTTADMPVFLFMPLIFLIISYWMTVPTLGFATFIPILLIALLSVITGQGLGQVVGAAFDDVRVGQAVATVVILFMMLMGGFFAQNIPAWLSWVRYISPFAYASNAALGVIFREPIPCDGSGGLGPLCFERDFADPEAVRESFAVSGTVVSNIACLLLTATLPRLIAYWFLRRKKAGERE